MSFETPRRARDIQAAPSRSVDLKQIGSTPVKAVLAILSVIILTVTGVAYATIGRLGGGLSSVNNLDLNDEGFSQGNAPDGAVDILLVGNDSRTDAKGNELSNEELEKLHAGSDEGESNTDTIMLIRVPNDGSRATAVSIPRDTYVHDADLGNMKINGVFAGHKQAKVDELEASDSGLTKDEIEKKGIEAGRKALLDQVHSLTGIDVDHYAEVGLLGFVLLTEAVGGVDVCLNEDVKDPMSGADFKAGPQTLQGADALAFVRQRYGLPRGDLDRITRQQAFMASLVSKALATNTLTNPNKLRKISAAVERSVAIDENWDVTQFATQLSDLAAGNVTFNTIPVTSVDGVGDYGESIITVDPDEVHEFMEELADPKDKADDADGKGSEGAAADGSALDDATTVDVLNAGTREGLAGGVGSWLKDNGVKVNKTSNAQPGVYTSSQIVTANADDERAHKLSEKLGGIPITVNENLDADSLIVVTADDYAGPLDESKTSDADDSTATDSDSDGADSDTDSGSKAPVGTPGGDFGAAEVSPEIDAGGNGPRCVN